MAMRLGNAELPFSPQPKPQHKRNKPTAKQRGAISDKVRKDVKERSQGLCERCGKKGEEVAHLVRRWKLQKTTINDVAMLCITCHDWADTTKEGRLFLQQFKERLGS